MVSYNELRKGCASSKYARGGRVGKDGKGRTVINIVMPQPASAPPNPAGMGAVSAPPPMPSGGPAPAPVPPAAAAMALNQMQGKPQAPGAFKRGGRVQGGAESGVGRLNKARAAKKSNGK